MNANALSRRLRRARFAAALAFAALALGLLVLSAARDVGTPVALASVGYAGSATCVRCHPGRFETWHRTFHRTMTQEATPEAVLGDFDDASYTYLGVTTRFSHSGDGYVMQMTGDGSDNRTYSIARTVGSRRIQQYVARVGDHYVRLPLAWNIEEKRWFHLNGGFLDPDGTGFDAHTTTWDANCIFCHNTKADPGYDWTAKTFASRVAELGIACEACHGPAAEHVARNENPIRRYFLYASGDRDPTIVNPAALPKEAQVQVCGHCHGQRVPNPTDRIRAFMSLGDPYTPGENLSAYTTPIARDTHLEGVDLSQRFWGDGTPRLTAYEYQGLLMSADYQRGELTCISCHSAHGGDPHGMIADEKRGAGACLQCHGEIAADVSAHTHHDAGSSGSNCYACHMPKITYGILGIHPSHRIQRPDPSRAWRYDMPEACTICHLNESAKWAAESAARLYGTAPSSDAPASPDFDVAESIRALLAGDVVQRSVAAMSLGEPASYTSNDVDRLWAVPFLTIAMDDRYPAVRHFAYRSLRALVDRAGAADPGVAASAAGLPDFDPEADESARAGVVAAWRRWWAALDASKARPEGAVPLDASGQPDAAVVDRLLRERRDRAPISIGE